MPAQLNPNAVSFKTFNQPAKIDTNDQVAAQTARYPIQPSHQNMRDPAQLSRPLRFAMCKATRGIHARGNQQEILDHYQKHNIYCLPQNTFAGFKQKAYNTFVALTLVHIFIGQKPLTQQNIHFTCTSVFSFLDKNGANAELLKQDVEQLMKNPNILDILSQLQNKIITPIHYVNSLINGSSDLAQARELIPETNKIPAELSGLRHTLIEGENGLWYETLPYYELHNYHDYLEVAGVHQECFHINGQVEEEHEGSAIQKVILGKGGSCKVIPAYDIANRNLVAFKKHKDNKFLANDIKNLCKAALLIPDELKHHFLFPATFHYSNGKKAILNNSKTMKGGMIFPLEMEVNEFSKLNRNLDFRDCGMQDTFEDLCFKQLQIFVEKTLVLEQCGVNFLDFKPENIIDNKIIDFLDIKPNTENIANMFKTAQYSMPHVFREKHSPEVLKTSNRYNLGAMIFLQITGTTATDPQLDPLLRLEPDIKRNQCENIQKLENGYALKGFPTATLQQIPETVFTKNGHKFTLFEQGMLKLAKQSMAEDRNHAKSELLNLTERLNEIDQLRLSVSKALGILEKVNKK